jgi:N,N-dimethylformamidase
MSPEVARPSVLGYPDRFSVAPGETIEFKISCAGSGEFRADVVRLRNGDTNPAGPGFLEHLVPTPASGTYPARTQQLRTGAAVLVRDGGGLALGGSGTVRCYAQPTTPTLRDQALISRWDAATGTGWWVGLSGGRLTLRLGDGTGTGTGTGSGTDSGVHETVADAPLHAWTWYAITASWHDGRTTVRAEPTLNSTNSLWSPAAGLVTATGGTGHGAPTPGEADAPTVLAACWDSSIGATTGHYNGKLDSPAVLGADGEPLAHWDFGAELGPGWRASDRCTDVGPHGYHGHCQNAPYRGMTGWNWTGVEEHCRHAPEQYGAIHFHDDALADAGWDTDVALQIPDELPSGVYALRVRYREHTDRIPFWVLPPRGTATAPVLLLFPTASYLAYANEHIVPEVPVAQSILGHTSVLAAADLHLLEHPELGLSTYDHHTDGSGVAHSSRLRPVVTMRPGFRHGTGSLWQFPADLHIVDWLTALGIEFDVATDEDLHTEGAALLERYRVVLTGSHPEYTSARMLDAFERYLGAGGRTMYLGGNGFYWVTSYHPEQPHLIEVRKGEGGCRAWQARPGELHMAFSAERGGLWRNRGRAPQKLFGVGFATEGMDHSSAYTTLADFADPRAGWLTEGLAGAAVIGAHGLVGGGAAGHECDRYDLARYPGARVAAGHQRGAALGQLPAGRRGHLLPVRRARWYGQRPGAGGRRVLQHRRRRRGVLDGLDRLGRQPRALRLRQRHIPADGERAPPLRRPDADRTPAPRLNGTPSGAAGRLAGWQAGRRAGRPAGRRAGRLAGWPASWLAGWLASPHFAYLAGTSHTPHTVRSASPACEVAGGRATTGATTGGAGGWRGRVAVTGVARSVEFAGWRGWGDWQPPVP